MALALFLRGCLTDDPHPAISYVFCLGFVVVIAKTEESQRVQGFALYILWILGGQMEQSGADPGVVWLRDCVSTAGFAQFTPGFTDTEDRRIRDMSLVADLEQVCGVP